MKILERVLWLTVVTGFLLKVFRLPLASSLIILGLYSLSMLYFFLSWLLFTKPKREVQALIVSIFSGIGLSLATIGVLFKIQQWPLSAFFLILATTALLAMTIVLFVMLKSHGPFARGLLSRTVPLLIACIGLYAVPGSALTKFYYRDDPEMGRLMIQHNTSDDPVERERLRAQMDSVYEARARAPFEYDGEDH